MSARILQSQLKIVTKIDQLNVITNNASASNSPDVHKLPNTAILAVKKDCQRDQRTNEAKKRTN